VQLFSKHIAFNKEQSSEENLLSKKCNMSFNIHILRVSFCSFYIRILLLKRYSLFSRILQVKRNSSIGSYVQVAKLQKNIILPKFGVESGNHAA